MMATGRMRRTSYVRGTAAEQIDVRRAIHEAPMRKLSKHARKNREKAARLNFKFVLFIAACLAICSSLLYGYITLNVSNTAALEEISTLEKQLNNMKLDNDEQYSRIMSDIDMAYVKESAMGRLGMQYAEEGQIIEVQGSGDDYVRQYAQLPQ